VSTQHHPTETTLGAWMILRNFFYILAFTKTLLPLRRHLHPGRFYCRTLSHPVHLEPCALFLHLVTPPPPPPPPIGKRSIVMCVSVCVFVCPRSYLRNCTSDLHQIFVHVTGGFKGGGQGGHAPKMPSTAKSRQPDPLNWPPPSSFSGSAPGACYLWP